MNIDRLRYYISQRLLNLTDINVYNKKAEISLNVSNFPYVVFILKSATHKDAGRKNWILELDFWNDSDDDSPILAASIDIKDGRTVDEIEYIGLDNSSQDEPEGFYKCDLDFEDDIPVLENDMSRFHQRYILQVY